MKISCDAIHSNCCGIYLIRNNINNKVYIGIPKNKDGLSHVSTIPQVLLNKGEEVGALVMGCASLLGNEGLENRNRVLYKNFIQ